MHANVILIGSTGLGAGDSNLGSLLLANFLRLLAERADLPQYIVLWNEGVKIALDESICINHLKRLEERSVDIVSCRTCIEFFGLEGGITAGRIGTMPEIQEILLGGQVLTV